MDKYTIAKIRLPTIILTMILLTISTQVKYLFNIEVRI